uniref:Uncharacterized protein n=1 Tax=Timema cristinae TaxID=61476 RepID=A0A7R9CJ45_TIMCR|nr:unnamed protein product [Timema cristinae]
MQLRKVKWHWQTAGVLVWISQQWDNDVHHGIFTEAESSDEFPIGIEFNRVFRIPHCIINNYFWLQAAILYRQSRIEGATLKKLSSHYCFPHVSFHDSKVTPNKVLRHITTLRRVFLRVSDGPTPSPSSRQYRVARECSLDLRSPNVTFTVRVRHTILSSSPTFTVRVRGESEAHYPSIKPYLYSESPSPNLTVRVRHTIILASPNLTVRVRGESQAHYPSNQPHLHSESQRGKGQQPSVERQKLQKELFAFRKFLIEVFLLRILVVTADINLERCSPQRTNVLCNRKRTETSLVQDEVSGSLDIKLEE